MRLPPTLNALLIAATLAAAPAAAQFDTVVLPSNPTAGEEVLISTLVATGQGPSALLGVETRVAGSKITIIATANITGFAAGGGFPLDAATPALPAGTYEVDLVVREVLPNGFVDGQPRRVTSITVAAGGPSTPRFRPLNGNWLDPGRPGWGRNVVQGTSGALFIGWFDYEAVPVSAISARDVQPNTWRVLSGGKWISPTTFRGVVYTTRGSPPTQSWNPATTRVLPAGYVTMEFSTADEARFEGRAYANPMFFDTRPDVFERSAALRRFRF